MFFKWNQNVKTLFCTHCWLKIAVITKTFLLSESRWGKCASPVAASPLALNVDMHNFSLTMMAWNDVLFQGWHERGCCLDWQVGALLSQASVRGAGWLAVATVEGCFLLCTVSSVTGQCEVFSRGLVAVKLGVHCGPSTGGVPLLIPADWSARVFFFPPEWKSKLGRFWFPVLSKAPGRTHGDTRPCKFYGEMLAGRDGSFH